MANSNSLISWEKKSQNEGTFISIRAIAFLGTVILECETSTVLPSRQSTQANECQPQQWKSESESQKSDAPTVSPRQEWAHRGVVVLGILPPATASAPRSLPPQPALVLLAHSSSPVVAERSVSIAWPSASFFDPLSVALIV